MPYEDRQPGQRLPAVSSRAHRMPVVSAGAAREGLTGAAGVRTPVSLKTGTYLRLSAFSEMLMIRLRPVIATLQSVLTYFHARWRVR